MKPKVKSKKEINLEIEMLLNENLFTKKILMKICIKK